MGSQSAKGSKKDSNKSSMSDEDWEDMSLRVTSAICLCLAKNVLSNVQGISPTKELWKKLQTLYQTKAFQIYCT